MKIKSKLFDKASGSIGSFTGKQSTGGLCLRSKQTSHQTASNRQRQFHQAVRLANIDWREATELIRQEWGDYGRSLTKIDSMGVLVYQTGLQAFISSYVLLTQASLFPQDLKYHVPQARGYLFFPTLVFFTFPNAVVFQNQSPFSIRFSSYKSPQQNNTINLNRKGFKFELNNNLPPDGYSDVQTTLGLPRIFIKVKRVEYDGSFSQSHVYHQAVYQP